ncbi:hypothetical protein D3C81_2211630 [compost metagenome]
MPGFRRTDKVVVRNVQFIPKLLDPRHDPIHELLRGLALFLRFLLDLLPVLIGPR